MGRHYHFSRTKLFHEHEERFFLQVQVGDTYTYNEDDYIFKDVRRSAGKYGVKVVYNEPRTEIYKKKGCFNFTVTSIIDKKEEVKTEDPLLFDVNELVI